MKTKINKNLAIILIAAFVLRLINLNQSLWLDEAISALAVKDNSFINLITKFSLSDFHPPLYYLTLKLWTNLFGYSEIALRLPSVIFGVLTVFFVYKIGGKKFGLLAGLFLAVNPLVVYYSQEARMYSLAAFAVTAAVYYLLNKKWLLWGVFFLIGLYTDYLVWFMIPIFFLIKRKTALVCVFLLPLVFLLSHQLTVGLQTAVANPLWSQVVGGFDFKAMPLTLLKFIFGRITIDNKMIYAAVFGPIALFYLWVLSEAKNKIFWLWLAIPLFLGVIISLKIPVYSYFRFLFILPAFCLLLAEGAKNKKIFTVVIVLTSVISLMVFNLNHKFQREDWRSAVNYMEKDSSKAYLPSLAQAAPIFYYQKHLVVNDKDTISISAAKTVYLVRYVQEIFDQNDFLRHVLVLSGYNKVEEKSFNGVVVWKYQYESRN